MADSFFEGMRTSLHTRARTRAEKVDTYSRKIALRYLAMASMKAPPKDEVGEAGWCRWLNEHTEIPLAVEAVRIFNFNFWDLVISPQRSPVFSAFLEHKDNYPGRDAALIFHVSKHSDWVIFDARGENPFMTSLERGMFIRARRRSLLVAPIKDFDGYLETIWSAARCSSLD